MLPNYTDSGLTNIMQDEKLRNDYMDTRYSRLEKGLSKSQDSGDDAGMKENKVWKSRISAIILIVVGVLFGGSFDSTKISLGDRLFSILGIPTWSDGTMGLHYAGIIGFVVIIIGIGMLNVTLEKWTRIWIWVACIAIFMLMGMVQQIRKIIFNGWLCWHEGKNNTKIEKLELEEGENNHEK